MLEDEVPVGLPAGPVAGELDRSALASHCAAVSYHMAAMARLFDPSAKAAAEPKKHRKVAEEGDVPRPKRELSQYNLCVLRRASAARAALRAAGSCAARCARAARVRVRSAAAWAGAVLNNARPRRR